LLWQLSYTELVFIKELWPDVTTDVFDKAIAEYAQRCRMFGGERA
jgi:undecaprenyl diphosphate synthase